jgi:hypothetical protein
MGWAITEVTVSQFRGEVALLASDNNNGEDDQKPAAGATFDDPIPYFD